jgi:hypothetical protein
MSLRKAIGTLQPALNLLKKSLPAQLINHIYFQPEALAHCCQHYLEYSKENS